MSRQTRRAFLKTTATAASGIFAGFAIAGTKASGNILGANDTVRVAVAGIHGRGSSHISAFAGMKNVQVAYLVDPDMRTWAEKVKAVERLNVNQAMAQAVADAGEKTPVVAHKRNRGDWLVTMRASDWFKMVAETQSPGASS